MEDITQKAAKILEEALRHPLALPIAVGIATVFVTVLVFFSISSAGGKKQKKKRTTKTDAISGGTTVVDGVRRSTRHVERLSTFGCLLLFAINTNNFVLILNAGPPRARRN